MSQKTVFSFGFWFSVAWNFEPGTLNFEQCCL
jgi:hypothetical protein